MVLCPVHVRVSLPCIWECMFEAALLSSFRESLQATHHLPPTRPFGYPCRWRTFAHILRLAGLSEQHPSLKRKTCGANTVWNFSVLFVEFFGWNLWGRLTNIRRSSQRKRKAQGKTRNSTLPSNESYSHFVKGRRWKHDTVSFFRDPVLCVRIQVGEDTRRVVKNSSGTLWGFIMWKLRNKRKRYARKLA